MSEQLDLFSPPKPEAPAAGSPEPEAKAAGAPNALGAARAAGAPVVVAPLPDQPARSYAVDPRNNVVLEASAGTGKTTVLVHRYVNLLCSGVAPSNILAITFTRKAAAEMRDRIIRELKRMASLSQADRDRWNELRDRLSDIDISTIDAFCLSLLREFPLEADLEPGFSMADETEVPRLMEEALDRALRICLLRAREDEDLALVLAQLGLNRARTGLAHLLQRRLVAQQALDRFLASGPRTLHVRNVCRDALQRLQAALGSVPGGLTTFLADGPMLHPRFRVLARDLPQLEQLREAPPATIRGVVERIRHHFVTQAGTARTAAGSFPPYNKDCCASPSAWKRHRDGIAAVAPLVQEALDAFSRDLNVILARGVRRMFAIALHEYRRTLEERSVLDFSDVLERAITLLRQMDEFAQSRFRLEARYQHVLVDEFQDTSRAQWQLVSLLIQAWGQGSGVAGDAPFPPSIFVVGDRKQSIYRFRDAEVTVLQEAADYIRTLRAEGASPRRAIAYSFRGRPPLLSFVNDLFGAVEKEERPDAFRFDDTDRFPAPVHAGERGGLELAPLAIAASETPEASAAAVADEVGRLLRRTMVRDRNTGVSRPAEPGDIAILFRSRASHREFEEALEARGIPAYVYKGLGFFDADEIKDLIALLRCLADPSSEIRAAAFLRSRFVRISDEGLCRLALRQGAGSRFRLDEPSSTSSALSLRADDRARLDRARASIGNWLRLADQIPPAELLDRVLADTAYDFELRGPRRAQARENVKKMRALIRRIQNRGYPTLRRIAEHLDSLSAGDESNAALEAVNAVNLMTVHAAKGLEFPIVFVVNLAKGAGGPRPPVRVVADTPHGEPSVAVASYISEADEDHREREAEETKRLLYVALTRARDALYLATVLKDGEMRPGRGSLGEILPPSLRALFTSATAELQEVEWHAPSGVRHLLRVVPRGVESLGGADAARLRHIALDSVPVDLLGPLELTGDVPRVAATTYSNERTAAGAAERLAPSGSADDAIVGTIVHRLFQSGAAPDDRCALERAARGALRPEERAQLEDGQRTIDHAVNLYSAVARRHDVAALIRGGACDYEVPFSFRLTAGTPGAPSIAAAPHDVILRGTIDCVVRRPDGSLVILEFKTGRRRAEHQQQLGVYVAAVRAMFPEANVTGTLVYPEDSHPLVPGL